MWHWDHSSKSLEDDLFVGNEDKAENFQFLKFSFFEPKVHFMFMFFFHSFMTTSKDKAGFFAVKANNFTLFTVLLIIVWRYGCPCV